MPTTPPPDDLAPPAAGQGVQLQTTQFVLHPGEEKFKCFRVAVPVDTSMNVSKFETLMSAGSHHFILYRSTGTAPAQGQLTEGGCTGLEWMFASGAPHTTLAMPDGVGLPIAAHQGLQFDMHYINTTTKDINVVIKLNIEFATGTVQRAASLISFNTGIRIPPNGTQTVTGTCSIPTGAKFFTLSSHTHKRATLASIKRLGGNGEEFVHTTDWENPDTHSWTAPNFLTFAPGERLQYSCTYENKTSSTISVGPSAEKNEMCMSIGYYFPQSTGGGCN